MKLPQFRIRSLIVVVAGSAFAVGGLVSFAGMDEESRRPVILVVLLLGLHLAGGLVASLFIAVATSAASWVGLLLGPPAAPGEAAGSITPEPEEGSTED